MATKTGKIETKIELSGEQQYRNACKDIKDNLKLVASEMKLVSAEFEDNGKSVKGLTSKQEVLKKRLDEQTRAVEEAEKALKTMRDAGIDPTDKSIRKMETDLYNAKAEVVKTQNAIKDTGEDIERTGIKFERLGDIAKAVAGMVAAAAAALGGLSIAAVKVGIDYESAFAGVRKTVDATEEQFKALSDGIRAMSTDIPMAAEDIAALAKTAGQLGVKTDDLLDFTRVVADLGVATNIIGQDGAAQIAKFANITGMSHADVDRFGSSIVALGNNFATTEADILSMATRLAGAGAQIGMSDADILGLATALSSVGIEAEMGGSAISKVLVNMSAAGASADKFNAILNAENMSLRDMQIFADSSAKAFKGLANSYGMTSTELKALMKEGNNLENFAKISGMTADEFKRAFESDAVGALQAFIGGLSNAEDAGSSAIEMLQEMGVSEVRLRDSLLRAAGAGDLLTNAVNLGNAAWSENSALTKEAEQRYGTMESQMTVLKNKASDLGVTFYGSVREPMAEVIQTAGDMVGSLTDAFASGGLDGFIKALGGVLADAVAYIASAAPMFARSAASLVQSFIKGIWDNSAYILETAGKIASDLASGLGDAVPLLKPVTGIIELLGDNIGILAAVLGGAVAGLIAFKAATQIQFIITGLAAAFQGQTLAAGAATVSMTAHKIASGAMSIATAIATGVLGLHNGTMTLTAAVTGVATAATTAFGIALKAAAGPIGIIIGLASALAAGITILVTWLNRESEEERKLQAEHDRLIDSTERLNDSLDSSRGSYEDRIKSIEAETGASRKLAEEVYSLAAAENKTTEEKQRLAAYVDILNDSMEGLNLQYDAENDALSITQGEIEKLITARENQARAIAAQERAVEIAKEQMSVEEQLNTLHKQRGNWEDAYANGEVKAKAYKSAISEITEKESILNEENAKLATSFEYVTEIIVDSMTNQTETVEAMNARQIAAAEERARAEEEAAMAAAKAQEEAAALQAKALTELGKEYDSLSDKATDMFNKLSDESKITVDDMIKTFEENQRIIGDWANNMSILVERGINEGLYQKLQGMGEQGAGYVAELVKASDEQLERLNELFESGGKLAVTALATSLGVSEDVVNAAAELANNASDTLMRTLNDANIPTMGKQIVDGLAEGIQKSEGSALAAISNLTKSIKQVAKETLEIQSPSKVFAEIGRFTGEGFVEGLESMSKKISGAVEDEMNHVVDTARKESAKMDGLFSGLSLGDLGANISGGLQSLAAETHNSMAYTPIQTPVPIIVSVDSSLNLDSRRVTRSTSKVQAAYNAAFSRAVGVVPA